MTIIESLFLNDGFFLVQMNICDYLSVRDICRLMQINKKFRERYYYILLKKIPESIPIFLYKRMFPFMTMYKKTNNMYLFDPQHYYNHDCGFNQDWIVFAIETGDQMIFKYFYDNHRSCVRCIMKKILESKNKQLLRLVYKKSMTMLV